MRRDASRVGERVDCPDCGRGAQVGRRGLLPHTPAGRKPDDGGPDCSASGRKLPGSTDPA